MRVCSIEGCGRKHVAKGLCSGHYNRTRYTSEQRHPKVAVACTTCGTVTLKHPAKKSVNRFCSFLCRDYFRNGGPMVCPLSARPKPKRQPKPKPAPFIPELRDCSWCGEQFTAEHPTKILCSDTCKAKAKRMRRRSRTAQGGGTYTWAEVMRVFIALNRCCAYCEQPIDGPPDPDHVVPISRGGSNSITNILPSCRPCNSDKRDLLLSEWNADRARRGLEPRTTSWDHLDQRVRHLTAA